MSAQDPEEAGDLGAALAEVLGRGGELGEKDGGDVVVAESGEDEVAAVDRGEELDVGPVGEVQRADAAATESRVPGQRVGEVLDRGVLLQVGERVQVPVVGPLAHLRRAGEIGNRLADGLDHELSGAGAGTRGTQLPGVVDRALDAQGRVLVVHLERVVAEPVLDADALGAVLEVGGDFASKGVVRLASEEAQHVAAGEAADRVVDQGRVDVLQGRAILKQDVAGPLGLVGAPVIEGSVLVEDVAQARAALAEHPVEHRGPVQPELAVEELLGLGEIVGRVDGIAETLKVDAAVLEVPSKPLTAVEAAKPSG